MQFSRAERVTYQMEISGFVGNFEVNMAKWLVAQIPEAATPVQRRQINSLLPLAKKSNGSGPKAASGRSV